MTTSFGDEPNGSVSPRRCFVVSAFGNAPDAQRRHKQVLRHLVRKVLEPAYSVVRADEIDDEGLITNQVIEHLLSDDLVVADLTGLNPNVFYEVAVRHAARKPIIHLVTKGQEIPFDVANMRAVLYTLEDPDVLEEAQSELRRKVQAIEESDFKAAPNPISAARDVALLLDSEQPEAKDAGELLAAFHELRDEVRGLARRIGADGLPEGQLPVTRGPSVQQLVLAEVRKRDSVSEDDLILTLDGVPPRIVRQALRALGDDKQLYLIDGKWSEIPF